MQKIHSLILQMVCFSIINALFISCTDNNSTGFRSEDYGQDIDPPSVPPNHNQPPLQYSMELSKENIENSNLKVILNEHLEINCINHSGFAEVKEQTDGSVVLYFHLQGTADIQPYSNNGWIGECLLEISVPWGEDMSPEGFFWQFSDYYWHNSSTKAEWKSFNNTGPSVVLKHPVEGYEPLYPLPSTKYPYEDDPNNVEMDGNLLLKEGTKISPESIYIVADANLKAVDNDGNRAEVEMRLGETQK
jgi:hypothetical protein